MASTTTSMNIRTDSEVKMQAEKLFAEFGLNMTTAVNMFLRQAIRKQAIPFELSLETASQTNKERHSHAGSNEYPDNDLLELFGEVKFADGYDYKALREGR